MKTRLCTLSSPPKRLLSAHVFDLAATCCDLFIIDVITADYGITGAAGIFTRGERKERIQVTSSSTFIIHHHARTRRLSSSSSRAKCSSRGRCGITPNQVRHHWWSACMLLGSQRLTQDVDFVVPTGQTRAARQELRNAGGFVIEPGTLRTHYQGVEIEILTPPSLFKEPYDAETPTMEVQQVRVLKPALILNAKCRSILGRANEDKKRTDAEDIVFLLQWFVNNPYHPKPTAAEVPNATKQFRDWFTATYCSSAENQALWAQAGFE
ncbi:conserved hypothetical protein [Histoplasma capsulatum var. duboisii H88]|uniref:Uncharacterized protein n=2 Tax=Ajellomyces capsulatus (strain H88) TaxID=544711 RepID=F0UA66_AJEC8|nr:conserved hypothetical protein [Histoplasma capsulatum var. duboisii H88]